MPRVDRLDRSLDRHVYEPRPPAVLIKMDPNNWQWLHRFRLMVTRHSMKLLFVIGGGLIINNLHTAYQVRQGELILSKL